MKNAFKSAAALATTLVALVAVILVLPAFTPPLAVIDNVPALNSGGDEVYASLIVNDATGVVTTVTPANTFIALAGAPLAVGESDGSDCITVALATGRFTIAARCGVGEINLSFCGNDIIGANNATILGAFHRIRAGATTLVAPTARRTELAAAARATLGCVTTVVDAFQGDTYDWRYTSGINNETVVTRAAQITVHKVLDK